MLNLVPAFKGEAKKVNNKIFEYNLWMIAHNWSGFDSYLILNNLLQWRSVVNLKKNGAGIFSLKIFNDYVDENKKLPNNVRFRCGKLHFKSRLRNIGVSYVLQPSLLKQELEHDENYEDTWEDKEDEWLPYVENDVLSTAFC